MNHQPQITPGSRIRGFFIFAAGLLLSPIVALMGDVAAGFVSHQPLVSALVFLLVSGLLLFLFFQPALRRWGLRQPRRASGILAIVLTVLFGFVLLRPYTYPGAPAVTQTPYQYWDLSTGSHVAYVHLPAQGTAQPYPILFLHGGPGGYITDSHVAFFQQLTQDGFDVYLFDQAGGGQSQRLDKPTEYTIDQAIQDIEAIRAEIGAEKIIPVGSSYGGTLALTYLAGYPNRVDKMLLPSTGPYNWSDAFTEQEVQTYAADVAGQNNPFKSDGASEDGSLSPFAAPLNLLVAFLSSAQNPTAATFFVSQDDFSYYLDSQVLSNAGQAAYCEKDRASLDAPATAIYQGFNIVANGNITAEANQNASDYATFADFADMTTPVLMIKGSCDYVDWPDNVLIGRALANSHLVRIEHVGHNLWPASQPAAGEMVYQVMRAFLLDEPPPVPYYTQMDWAYER